MTLKIDLMKLLNKNAVKCQFVLVKSNQSIRNSINVIIALEML